jgi:hypothetical protein
VLARAGYAPRATALGMAQKISCTLLKINSENRCKGKKEKRKKKERETKDRDKSYNNL